MILTEISPSETNVHIIYNHIEALAALESDIFKEVKNREGFTFSLGKHYGEIKGLIKCFEGIEREDLESYPKNEIINDSLSQTICSVEEFFNLLTNRDFNSDDLLSIGDRLPNIHADAYKKMGRIKLHSTSPYNSRVQQVVSKLENLSRDLGRIKNDSEKVLQYLQDQSNKKEISKRLIFLIVRRKNLVAPKYYGVCFS